MGILYDWLYLCVLFTCSMVVHRPRDEHERHRTKKGRMSPQYMLRCRHCKFERPLLLTSYADYDQIVSTMPCEECGKCDWIKLPTTANIPKSGRYSFEDNK